MWITLAIAGVLLVGVLAGGYKIRRHWEPVRLVKQARAFAKKGDDQNAALALKRALQIDGANAEATWLMAEITEKIGAPDSMMWWRRVVELRPDSSEARIAWASTALRFGEPKTAVTALDGIPANERRTALYQSTAAALAAARGNAEAAGKYYAEAARLDPANPVHRYNNATAKLSSSDPAVRRAGRTDLEELLGHLQFRALALRGLVADAVTRGDSPAALASSKTLQGDPACNFEDRLVHLELLRTTGGEWLALLTQLQKDAGNDAARIRGVLIWMVENKMNAESIAWTDGFIPEMRAHPQIGIPLSEAHIALRDWAGLQALTKEVNWAGQDYQRTAYLALAAKETGNANAFRAYWTSSLASATKSGDALRSLAGLAQRWGWMDQLRDLLWVAGSQPSDATWALEQLYRYYAEQRDTRGLLRVTTRLIELKPDDAAAKNNTAMFSLLLKENVARAADMARELYSGDPKNSTYASTYAYALQLQGQGGKAVQIMELLSPSQLTEPSAAAYYGIVLAGNGKQEAAEKYLKLADPAKLLPEEKELVESALHSKMGSGSAR